MEFDVVIDFGIAFSVLYAIYLTYYAIKYDTLENIYRIQIKFVFTQILAFGAIGYRAYELITSHSLTFAKILNYSAVIYLIAIMYGILLSVKAQKKAFYEHMEENFHV